MQQEHIRESFQLSPQQKRLWLLQQDGAAYRLQAAVSIEGDVDVVALRDACRDVLQRYEILRTDFHLQTGADVPTQIVDDAFRPLREQDLTELTLAEGEAAIEQLFSEALRSPLRRRLTIIALSAHKHVMFIELPALCADHATLTNLLSEIARSYTDRLNGSRNDGESLQYAELSTWLNELLESEETKAGREYWLKQPMADSQLTHLLFEKRPVGKEEFAPRFISSRVDQSLAEKLRMLARQEQITLPILLLADWQILLWRLSGQPEVLVGVAYDGRRFEETRRALGMLTRYLPVQMSLAETGRITELLKQLDQRTKEIEKWQEYFSWDELADTSANAESAPFFSILFDFHQLPVLGGDGDLTFSVVREYSCLDRFKLRLSCTANADVLDLQLHYDPAYFDLNDVERMGREFQQLLKSICAEPEIPIGELNLLDEVERERLLLEFNETRVAYPDDRQMLELFGEQVERSPEALAVIYGEQRLSYEELDHKADRLARYLLAAGVGEESRVGLYLRRSPELLIGVLGVLKAGAAYVPLEPGLPAERVSYMLRDAGIEWVLVESEQMAELSLGGVDVVLMDGAGSDPQWLAEAEDEPLPSTAVSSDHLAYILYTSGSTGQPKGVMVQHGGLAHYLRHAAAAYLEGEIAGSVVSSPLIFDATLTTLLAPLLVGKSVELLGDDETLMEQLAARLFSAAGNRLFKLTPAHLEALQHVERGIAIGEAAHVVVVGGEQLDAELLRQWKTELLPRASFVNEYGPTEAVVGCSVWWLRDEAGLEELEGQAAAPIGRPIANTHLYVLGAAGELLPLGSVGELYIGGGGLARGYLNQPELTEQRFVDNPFGAGRLYRTGDLVRWLASGELLYVGRSDEQVKVRGYRIELGEIEAVLRQQGGVQQAVVVAQAAPSGGQRLVAYVVGDQETVNNGQLRSYLSETLPDYMVPASFVWLNALPLTPNGKVDRNALTLMKAPASEGFAAPRTPVEEKLAAIWCEVLRCEQVGIHDNFLELGGDSILSIQVVARASRAGLRLTPRDLFEHPTVEALAAVVGRARTITAEQGAVTGSVPLTPVQRSFFAEPRVEPEHYNQSLMLQIGEPRYTAAVLRQTVKAVVVQHDALRLRFTQSAEGDWQQFNAAAEANDFFSVVDLRHLGGAEQTAALEAHANGLQASLNLSAGPLLRVCYYNLGEGTPARLLIIVHHLAMDGVSWRILLEDVASGCEQAAAGQAEINLGAKTTSYKEWAERLQEYAGGNEVKEQEEYWTGVARRGRQVKRLPVDGEGGANTIGEARAVEVSLTRVETTALLSEVPAVYRTEINEVLLTALVMAVGSWTGEPRVLLELEGHGREEIGEDVDVTRTVGWFTSVYPVVLEVVSGAGEGQALKAVKEQVRGVRGRGLGWGLLRWMSAPADEMKLEAELSFNYLGQFDQMFSTSSTFSLAAESTGAERSPHMRRKYLVDITGSVFEGRLHMSWTYNENIHRRETIERVAEEFISALRNLIAHCQSPEAGGYTPSDFPDAGLTQSELDELIADMGQPEMEVG